MLNCPRTNKRRSFSKYLYDLHCIVEISLELTVKRKNYNEKFLYDGHFFYAVFIFLVKIKSHCNIMIYDKKDVFQLFYLFFHYHIRYFSYEKTKKYTRKCLSQKNVQYCTLNCERRQISKCLDVMKKK
jgi:hypothetical protein